MMVSIHSGYPCDHRNFKRGRTGDIKFIVIHYVGALGGAEANCRYYGNSDAGASAHYFVDHGPGAEVWRSVADSDTAWHCGGRKHVHPVCRNDNSIGIEMCCHQDKAGRWYFDHETVDRAVELTRMLMERYHISADHVVRHYDVTGKNCPAPFVNDWAAWEGFKERLEEDVMTQEQFNKMFSSAMREYELEQAAARNRPVSDWHVGEWADAKRLGLMDGTNPGGVVLREQLAAVAVRLYKLLRGPV